MMRHPQEWRPGQQAIYAGDGVNNPHRTWHSDPPPVGAAFTLLDVAVRDLPERVEVDGDSVSCVLVRIETDIGTFTYTDAKRKKQAA